MVSLDLLDDNIDSHCVIFERCQLFLVGKGNGNYLKNGLDCHSTPINLETTQDHASQKKFVTLSITEYEYILSII